MGNESSTENGPSDSDYGMTINYHRYKEDVRIEKYIDFDVSDGRKKLLAILLDAFETDIKNKWESAYKWQIEYEKSLDNCQMNQIYMIFYLDRAVGCFEIKNNRQLSSFGIIKKFQRKGIGTDALKIILRSMSSLIVIDSTEAGKKLYSKFPEIMMCN